MVVVGTIVGIICIIVGIIGVRVGIAVRIIGLIVGIIGIRIVGIIRVIEGHEVSLAGFAWQFACLLKLPPRMSPRRGRAEGGIACWRPSGSKSTFGGAHIVFRG